MTKKIFSSLLSGIYVAIGATAYLLIENPVIGAIFFTSGICLVTCYCNMLVTRVFPLFALGEYKLSDVIISFIGNTAGAAVCALMLSVTRLNKIIAPEINAIVTMKYADTYLSIFIMSIFCGFMVAAGCLAAKVFKDNRGIAVFMCVFFVAVFVVCGFDHVVANAFYFAFYMFNTEFSFSLKLMLFASLFGNAVGGIGCGLMYKYNLSGKD